jgi:peptide/nickel transport system substrate-binding protein
MKRMNRHVPTRVAIGLAMVGALVAAVPAATTPVTAQPPEPTREETVVFDIASGQVPDPELWNPFLPSSRVDPGFRQAMIEPLFLLNYETEEIEPWLATEMTSNDTLDDWTLTLRPDVLWSDGEPFSADDVVFTIQVLLDNAPELNGSAALATYVESVEKVDDVTVRFVLSQPNPRFQLDFFAAKISAHQAGYIVPQHIWEGQDPLTFTNYDPEQGWPVFTGPYTLVSATPTDFVYERDDDWWGVEAGFEDLPAPRSLVWTALGPEETRTARMADSELDSLMDITPGAFEALRARNENVIAWQPDLPWMWPDPCSRNLELNGTVAPWDDPEMRWALNYAIDREAIVAVAYEGSSSPNPSIYPAYPALDRFVELAVDAGLYEEYPLLQPDPDRTREILESKGYTFDGTHYELDGDVLTLDIEQDEPTIETQRVAQVLVEQLQAVGIDASTRNVAEGTWIEDYSLGNFEAQVTHSTCGSVNEPWASLNTLNASLALPVGERTDWGSNGVRWQNTEYSEIVDEMGTLPLGDPAIDDLFLQAWEIFLRELPVIPITQARKLIPFDTTYWTGWPSTDDPYIQPPTWWQSTHKIIHNLQPAS